MATLAGSRVDTWVTRVSIAGVDLGAWDTFSGGETDSEELIYRPAGYNQQISLGGFRSYGNVTVGRYWDDWVNSMYRWLSNGAGSARGLIGRYPFTATWVQLGGALFYGGTLKAVTPPDVDSMGSDAALIELEFTIDTLS